MKLLEIQSSPRGESSDSITLTKSFIEACKSDNGRGAHSFAPFANERE